MLASQYEQNRKQKRFFLLPNPIFDLELNVYELAVYAYLIRIEDRRTWQCIVSYPAIAGKRGISVNTVAKYVRTLEERGLIRTERTDVMTRDGLKRNGCLKYTILPVRNAIDLYYERQLAELRRGADIHKARMLAERKGVEFHPADTGQTA